jgi:carbon storage regulator CsrA
MLVLTRRPTEKVLLPAVGLTIQVVAVKPGVVRLGIDAPPAVAILREELVGRPVDPKPACPDDSPR